MAISHKLFECQFNKMLPTITPDKIDLPAGTILKFPGTVADYEEILNEYVNEKGQKYFAYGHDYHPDLPTDGNFLNNGLVDPYRNPHG